MNKPLKMYRMLPFLGLLAVHCAGAMDAGATLSARFPAGSLATVEAAESAQAQAASEKARIQLHYVKDEQACSGVFFVNPCRDQAKERRRAALEPVRLIQIEADREIRRMRGADKDKALIDRRREKEAEAIRMEQDTQQQETAQSHGEKGRERVLDEQRHAQDGVPRATGFQARPARLQMEAADDAQKRAANVAAYDRKIKSAQAHQRDIAARKAEKDRKRKIQLPSVPPSVAGLPPTLDPAFATLKHR